MTTFSDLDLIEPLQRALASQNYTTPTPIQAQTIPHGLAGTDVLGCAQTGTGKTAAFALPILDLLGGQPRPAKPGRPQALVLAPTRELAIQIGDSFRTYGKHLKLRHVMVFGGVNQNGQVREMQRGAHILVATPGRLLDLMQQGFIDLRDLEVFVLDEADRMLDMGFLPDLKRIIAKLPTQRQSLFFSATMAPKIASLAKDLLFNPVSVNVTPETTSVEKIQQQILMVAKGEKQRLLEKVLLDPAVERTIVFTRTKRGANTVAKKLEDANIPAAVIHGNKSQGARQRALESFRRDKVRVLVATDVAARGIDIDDVSHVINYDLPIEPESYVHRIGRTGRAGAAGVALSFCTADETDELRAIERLIDMQIPRHPDHNKVDSARDSARRGTAAGQSRQSAGNRGARDARGDGDGRPQSRRRGQRNSSSRRGSTTSRSSTPKQSNRGRR